MGSVTPLPRSQLLRVLVLIAAMCLALVGCEGGDRKRPYGWVRVGKVADLRGPESLVSRRALVVRLDGAGFSAMSSLCTHDLVTVRKEGDEFVCGECGSRFAADGSVRKGPAKHPLPYYHLRVDRGEFNGPLDSLYAEIGREVSREWRLPLSSPIE